MEGFIVGINMRVEWKAGNEGRASTDAGVVLEVPAIDSGLDPHSGEEVVVRCIFFNIKIDHF